MLLLQGETNLADPGVKSLRPEGYTERTEDLGPWKMHVVSYQLGQSYYCTVDNVDPGAVLARGSGQTLAEAEAMALEKARELMARTRVLD